MKTLLELSLRLKVPVVNGLRFSPVSPGDLAMLSAKLAHGAIHMASMCDGKKTSYTGEVIVRYIVYRCIYFLIRSHLQLVHKHVVELSSLFEIRRLLRRVSKL